MFDYGQGPAACAVADRAADEAVAHAAKDEIRHAGGGCALNVAVYDQFLARCEAVVHKESAAGQGQFAIERLAGRNRPGNGDRSAGIERESIVIEGESARRGRIEGDVLDVPIAVQVYDGIGVFVEYGVLTGAGHDGKTPIAGVAPRAVLRAVPGILGRRAQIIHGEVRGGVYAKNSHV